MSGQYYFVPFQGLQAIFEHRAVFFYQNVFADFDLIIGRNADYITVKSGMMDFA